jgi:hypothetical protein
LRSELFPSIVFLPSKCRRLASLARSANVCQNPTTARSALFSPRSRSTNLFTRPSANDPASTLRRTSSSRSRLARATHATRRDVEDAVARAREAVEAAVVARGGLVVVVVVVVVASVIV